MKTLDDILAEARISAENESESFQTLVSDLEALLTNSTPTATVESAVVTLSNGTEVTLVASQAPAA